MYMVNIVANRLLRSCHFIFSLLRLECHSISIFNLNLIGLFSNRRGKGRVAPGDSEWVWIGTGAFWHSIAGRVLVRCVATHRTNSRWIWIHCTKIMITCFLLYLSDSPGRTEIRGEFALTGTWQWVPSVPRVPRELYDRLRFAQKEVTLQMQ